MHLIGERTINLPINATWELLNDAAVLQRCIPGCEELQRKSDFTYSVILQATVGPIKAKFGGSLDLSDIKPLESYNLTFQGSAGAMGFGKGVAKVRLETSGDKATRLQYDVDASVGGKVAQVGSRLVESVAKKMAESFFTRFEQEAAACTPESTVSDSYSTSESENLINPPRALESQSKKSVNPSASFKWKVAIFLVLLVALGASIFSS